MADLITVKTAWFWRKSEDGPELIVAWDEFTYDGWPSGFDEAVQKEFDAMKQDDSGYGVRIIDIAVPLDDVIAAFIPPQLQGEVVDPRSYLEQEGC